MTRADLHHLVDQLPDEAVDGISTLVRKVVLRQIDPDQFWFWTPEWQNKEREVDVCLARGKRGKRGTVQQSSDAFLGALDDWITLLDTERRQNT